MLWSDSIMSLCRWWGGNLSPCNHPNLELSYLTLEMGQLVKTTLFLTVLRNGRDISTLYFIFISHLHICLFEFWFCYLLYRYQAIKSKSKSSSGITRIAFSCYIYRLLSENKKSIKIWINHDLSSKLIAPEVNSFN